MSIDVIKEQIFNFLSTDTPEVMAIKGEWGVGKTFSWKKFLTEANAKNDVKLDRYSYVSLFGINSLEAFKYTIFENVIKKEIIGTEASIDTFKNNATSLAESFGRRSINLFRGAPIVKNINPAIETISFLSLRKTLICIDDLERKGNALDIKDILGLVSLLKEQKKCKVVLLLNDGEEGTEDFKKYREKVIDVELKFAPSPEECASIAYSDNQPYHQNLKKHVAILGIKNIRILKKIERLIELAIPLAQDFETEITEQIIHSLALFSWCYYCSDNGEDIPTLEFVTSKGYSILGLGDDEVDNDKEKNWRAILQGYNYQVTDELDVVLANAVKTGFFIEADFKTKATAKNQEIIAAKSKGSFSEAWKLYHDSFDDNRDEVINKLEESFSQNCEYITPHNLHGTVTLFRELGENAKASSLIDKYIERHEGQKDLFDLKEINTWGDIKDPEMVKKFNDKFKESSKSETVEQVLEKIAGRSGWNQSDEVVLANTTVDDYYNLFKTVKSKRLSSFISTCLKFGQFSNASDQQKEIADRATQALKKIGSESDLNKIRIRKFGVTI